MAQGGARIRSGPPPDPNSGRSERRGFKLTALPAEGYQGEPPAWPLTRRSYRESKIWLRLWKTPQACAWAMPSEAWRVPIVALYARVSARAEDPDAPVALYAQLHRLGDQIGMTTAGLAEMGWKVAVDETAAKRADLADAPAAVPARKSARDRMSVVGG